jgi:tetratricopeptide (TPR) repeat protein
MPIGRFQALEAYRAARRLTPQSPDPPYRMAQMGLALGGDDGERIAQEGLERVLELDPLYRNAWDEWLTLYRNAGGRRRMIERLAPFRAQRTILTRLALLKIEDESYAEADALLDSALARDAGNGSLLAPRSQSALESGDSAAGIALYRQALAHATTDSADILWHQVIGIATPREVRAWTTGVEPRLKGAWLASFWASRNPDLFAGVNHRIVEHFARLRFARKNYPLQHPLISYHRSVLARTLNLEPSTGEREFNLRCEILQAQLPAEGGRVPSPGVSSVRGTAFVSMGALWYLTDEEKENLRQAIRSGGAHLDPALVQRIAADPFAFAPTMFLSLGFDLRNVDSTAGRVGYNLSTGLDDRGVMYLRFGPPGSLLRGGDNALDPRCNSIDVERWRYPDGTEARFDRPSAFSRGLRTIPEMTFRPMNERQFTTMKLGLMTDASSEPAPLSFGVWTAQFRDRRDTSLTDLLVVSTVGEVAAALVGGTGGEIDRSQGSAGWTELRGSAGRYELLAHARTNEGLGRQALSVSLRSFAEKPSVSDLLLTKSWSGDADRDGMLARLTPSLTFDTGDTVRCYTEIYGLPRRNGLISYTTTYLILRSDNTQRDVSLVEWPNAQSLRYERARLASSGPVVESVNILPGPIPSGRYLLRLELRDPLNGSLIGRATAAFEVR